ncbi:MAG: M48 family metallopeptidase [Magnetococcales bacterium]|nr:M48 family metallopeptidase [Magnetococcales bacterium]
MRAVTQSCDSPPAAVDNHLIVDDLRFTLRHSLRRRTLQITVERTGELVLSSPPDVDKARLEAFVLEKRFWIYTKLAEKEPLWRRVPTKAYVDGEGFLYLGRSYRLRLVDGPCVPVKLRYGRFLLCRTLAEHGRDHLIQWYSARAKAWLWEKAQAYLTRMEVNPAGIKVQDLGYRWGSCGKGDWLYFHWKTILLPAHIAEYVVVHELAHLHQPHHTPAFWQRVERAMPDFERRKIWLAEHGIEVEGI